LSEGIDREKFLESLLVQPDLFLRLRPGKEEIVKEKLQKAAIEFRIISESCIAMNNSTKVDPIIELDSEAVIQDLNSQRIGEFLASEIQDLKSQISVWDCCAGSGGKSIMAFDLDLNIDLIVTDVRESILSNLKKRFKAAGIKKYNSFVTDLTKPHLPLAIHNSLFDLILCDAPCTGSGTWSRTPEQLYLFDESKINEFASLQRKITLNTISHLKPGGHFAYLTCSVFKKENEEIVEFIGKNSNLKKIKMEILKGYDKKADTMFAALFQKPL
jgi:16S rRNA (cytosine967-C5)-methyltransferase